MKIILAFALVIWNVCLLSTAKHISYSESYLSDFDNNLSVTPRNERLCPKSCQIVKNCPADKIRSKPGPFPFCCPVCCTTCTDSDEKVITGPAIPIPGRPALGNSRAV